MFTLKKVILKERNWLLIGMPILKEKGMDIEKIREIKKKFYENPSFLIRYGDIDVGFLIKEENGTIKKFYDNYKEVYIK